MSAWAARVPDADFENERRNRLAPRSQDPPRLEVLHRPGTEDALFEMEDSSSFTDELLRRYDVPYAEPWPHGGINE